MEAYICKWRNNARPGRDPVLAKGTMDYAHVLRKDPDTGHFPVDDDIMFESGFYLRDVMNEAKDRDVAYILMIRNV